MHALVTGGAGFIGSHLVDTLIDAGAEVRVLDDLSSGKLENLSRGARLIEGSVTDPEKVEEAVRGCEVVFHLAARGAVARSVADPALTDEVNVHGTVLVLTAARDAGARRVVFASSSSVYGGAAALPTPESAELRPRSPYAVSKLAGEWCTRVFAELFDLETVALRYFNVFGPRQRADSIYSAVIPLFASALLDGKTPTIFGDGHQCRDFTYVLDVVGATHAAATAPARVCSGQVYNVAPGRPTTLLELLDTLGTELGATVAAVHAPPRAGDVARSHSDSDAARRDLEWQPRWSLADGLHETVAWLRASR